jgi:RimJ/RimL family protein N-acetyltransferase
VNEFQPLNVAAGQAMHVPRIETERLLLSKLRLQDCRQMFAYRSHPQVTRFQLWRPARIEEVQEMVRKVKQTVFGDMDSWYQLGIFLRNRQELIGDLGMHFLPPDNQQTEIGFTIAPGHQRNGYGTEAVRAALDYLFGTLHKHRVTASVAPENSASRGLLEKIGMRKEGHFRQSVWVNDRWEDDVVYALLSAEWQRGRPSLRRASVIRPGSRYSNAGRPGASPPG